MKRWSFPFLCIFFILASSCTNTEIGNSRDANPEAVYFDYKIWGEEGKDDAGCLIQYRFGGEDGTTLVLNEPSKVTLDGKQLTVDSSKVSGAYYEMVQPLATFAGKHTIIFTNPEKKEYREDFNFPVFSLAEELPEKLHRQPFTIKIKDYPDDGPGIRLVMTDTAFTSDDFTGIVPVENGEIRIDTTMLSGLKNGPLSIEFFREEERRVKSPTKEGGRISISYGFKRETELVEP